MDFSAKNPVFLEKDRKTNILFMLLKCRVFVPIIVYGINHINKFKNGFAYEKRNITVFLKIHIR